MRWDGLFDDLEAQAEQLLRAERAAQVEGRARAEFGAVRLVDRLRPATGTAIRIACVGSHGVSGELHRIGPDWVQLIEPDGPEWVLNLGAVVAIAGLGRLVAPPGQDGIVRSRLGLRHVLRAIARDRSGLRLCLADGGTLDGTVDRVGQDFLELAAHAPGEPRRRSAVREVLVVPFVGLAALRRAP